MGRQSSCLVRFEDKMISGKHCRIYRDKGDSQKKSEFNTQQLVYLEDLRSVCIRFTFSDILLSSNGTYINSNKVGKGQSRIITNNNEITLVPRRENAEPVVFIYQDACTLSARNGPQDEIYNDYDVRETLGS